MESQNGITNQKKGRLSDEDIIELYWKRNEDAIKETDKKYGKYLFTIAYNIIHNHQDSEECLNDTYLGTWERIPPARPTVFQVFLSRIMRNIAINRQKRNVAGKRIPQGMILPLEELEESVQTDMSVEDEIAVRALAAVLNRFLSKLSERDEFIFVCRYYYCDPVKHIAAMLQIGEATVFRSLAKMKESLKELLEKEGIDYAG